MPYITLTYLSLLLPLFGATPTNGAPASPQRVADVSPSPRVIAAAGVVTPPAANTDTSTAWRWQTSPSAVALVQGERVIWRFNYETTSNTPYFHPVSTVPGEVLSWDRPPDHEWHHGMWFCWKFINGVNYWEHSGSNALPDGRTEWSSLRVVTRDDHSASIHLALSYHPAGDNQAVLREQRQVDISAPDREGVYHFDWTLAFTAVADEVTLDRVPPKEQPWGGYAGMSVRFAEDLTQREAVRAEGPAEFDEGGRYRGRSAAMDYNGLIRETAVGLAVLDHPNNPRHPTPWYVIRSSDMSYINASLLSDEPLVLKQNQQITLRYRLIIHPNRWDTGHLQAAFAQFASPAVLPVSR